MSRRSTRSRTFIFSATCGRTEATLNFNIFLLFSRVDVRDHESKISSSSGVNLDGFRKAFCSRRFFHVCCSGQQNTLIIFCFLTSFFYPSILDNISLRFRSNPNKFGRNYLWCKDPRFLSRSSIWSSCPFCRHYKKILPSQLFTRKMKRSLEN